jgi:hypothetical protein
MKSEWFVYSILQIKPVGTMPATHITNDAIKEMALKLLTLAWQQSQQLLVPSNIDTHNDADTANTATTTTVPLKLNFTSLATALKLACITKAHRTAANWLSKEYRGFIGYEALADIHNKQPLLRNTKGKHTIGVSSELICTSLWHKNTVKHTIDEYGSLKFFKDHATDSTETPLLADDWLTATAVVPVHARDGLNILNSNIELAEKQHSAEVFHLM